MFDPLSGHRRFITIGVVFAVMGVVVPLSPAIREKTSATDIILSTAVLLGVAAILIAIGVVIGRRRMRPRQRSDDGPR